MRRPAYAVQPKTLRPGAWVRFSSDRFLRIAGELGVATDPTVQVVALHEDYTFDVQTHGGRLIVSVRRFDVVLLTPDEAAPHIEQRRARLEREDAIAANRAIDVSGRSHFARRRC